MVFRCFTEKKRGFDTEASLLLDEMRGSMGIKELSALRIFCRYDVEGISEEAYRAALPTVFSQCQSDYVYERELPDMPDCTVILAVEPLPGQYDQRADSCAQCIQLLTAGERPQVSAAKVYALFGSLYEGDIEKIRERLINTVECRQAALEIPETLERQYNKPDAPKIIEGLVNMGRADLQSLITRFGLAMDLADALFVQDYFARTERRDPTETELRVIDTYWSDHCRHTTFNTVIDVEDIHDPNVSGAYKKYLEARSEVYGRSAETRPQTLMDIAVIPAKLLKKRGMLDGLDESEEINACSVRVEALIDGKPQPWLLMFKNETHNHPTEIEPFGGAATCIGGAIRDPLSGRAYVYQAMRITGGGDPRAPLSETMEGKLPQRRLAAAAAAGYSSYGNQIGIATGLVSEFYHPGFVAKRMELGAVVGAAPEANVIRKTPQPGDAVILLGGRTGRDGIGGATGSSKTHTGRSLTESAAEVQKGNAPEERKIQRLFRKPEICAMIKRCNDFGAGGVCVAIGELSDGLSIDLSLVRKKYEGLSGTELAISESQERMAVVVAPENERSFIAQAETENLEAYTVARITGDRRLTMSLDGAKIVDLSRDFLSSNGASKKTAVRVPEYGDYIGPEYHGCYTERTKCLLSDIRFCSRRGIIERFDGSIGAGSVVMPLGGKTQLTPCQSMAAKLPALDGECSTCSVMAFGFDPYHCQTNPFTAARDAVVTSLAKLVAAGCNPENAYLSLQEYFERLKDKESWAKPFSALLGALEAQLELSAAAVGGKDSMSGSFHGMNVPPSLLSFAIAVCETERIISPEFKQPGNYVYLFPAQDSLSGTKRMWMEIRRLGENGLLRAAWALTEGGTIEALAKMSFGNLIGFESGSGLDLELLFRRFPGAIVAECRETIDDAVLLGKTIEEPELRLGAHNVSLSELISLWESPLEELFPTTAQAAEKLETLDAKPRPVISAVRKFGIPRAVIPVFPGTNCEYDTARAIIKAGGKPEIILIRNLNPSLLADSAERLIAALKETQMLILPGGFSGGDEPDGSGKFIAAFFRNPGVTDAVHELIHHRDGLALGICNGFQALLRLGLLPFGEIRSLDDTCPTLTVNSIGRHQSRYVATRICSTASPWLNAVRPGEIHTIPISHGEGRFTAPPGTLRELAKNGLIATQYVDELGRASMDTRYNPSGSDMAVEGIISPDGRIFGKMGHTERYGNYIAKNIHGNKHQPVFESGVSYYL